MPDSEAVANVNVLNQAYNPSGFKFTLSGVKHVANTSWCAWWY